MEGLQKMTPTNHPWFPFSGNPQVHPISHSLAIVVVGKHFTFLLIVV